MIFISHTKQDKPLIEVVQGGFGGCANSFV